MIVSRCGNGTTDEISLVCEAEKTPSEALEIEPGWKALKISDVLNFSMIGIIAKLSKILAEAKICIFVVSISNTDYIFMKVEDYDYKCLVSQYSQKVHAYKSSYYENNLAFLMLAILYLFMETKVPRRCHLIPQGQTVSAAGEKWFEALLALYT